MPKSLLCELYGLSGRAARALSWAEIHEDKVMTSFWQKEFDKVEEAIDILIKGANNERTV